MNEKITIDLALAQAILNYLGTKPYAEVFGLVQEIQNQAQPQLKPVQLADNE